MNQAKRRIRVIRNQIIPIHLEIGIAEVIHISSFNVNEIDM